MGNKSLVPAAIETYVTSLTRETEALARIREETARHPRATLQISPEQGAFLGFLARTIGAKKAVEVGTFTGYSALATLLGMPEDGRLVACDVSREWTDVARKHWQWAGVDHRIDLRLAPAADTLAELLRSEGENSYDLAFIDADKGGYDTYYERCLALVRPGGLVVMDNMLWYGKVTLEGAQDADTEALKALSLKVRDDARVDASLVTVGDGLLLARKR